MFRLAGRGCSMGCLGCLIPTLLVLAFLIWVIHLLFTPPNYGAVRPTAINTAVEAGAAQVSADLANGNRVAAIALTDGQATTLLRQALNGYAGLSDLSVHALANQVVVSGKTALLNHPLVVTGSVKALPGSGSVVHFDFSGLAIGQLDLPKLIPELLTHQLHPQLDLSRVVGGAAVSLVCQSSKPGRLILGFAFSSSAPPDPAACRSLT